MNDKTYWTVVDPNNSDRQPVISALVVGAAASPGYVDAVTGTGELHGQYVPRFNSRKAARAYAASRIDKPTAHAYRLGPARESKTWIVVRTNKCGDRLGMWSGAESFGSDAIVAFPHLAVGDVAVFNSRKQARNFQQYRAQDRGYKYTVESVDV